MLTDSKQQCAALYLPASKKRQNSNNHRQQTISLLYHFSREKSAFSNILHYKCKATFYHYFLFLFLTFLKENISFFLIYYNLLYNMIQ